MTRQTRGKVSTANLELPSGVAADLLPIGREALRIHESAVFSAQGQFEQAKFWRQINVWLGVAAAIAAAIAGAAGLAGSRFPSNLRILVDVIAGILALVAAALSSTMATINASRRMSQAQSAANGYLRLQTLSRQLVLVDLLHLDYDQARTQLEQLSTTQSELNKSAEPIGWLSYRRAQKNIAAGGQTYDVDQP